jgi:hypothetical protein
MTSLSDTLTLGLVLVLLFGSIALYLYTRIQQAEQKISLLESILLDLKMSAEVKSYTELPAHTSGSFSNDTHDDSYAPYDDTANENEERNQTNSHRSSVADLVSEPLHNETDIEEYKSAIAEAITEETTQVVDETKSSLSNNYEAMTLKELQTLAKTRGISGGLKKQQLIEALKTSDKSLSVEPGSISVSAAGSSFLETSGPFLEQESNNQKQ